MEALIIIALVVFALLGAPLFAVFGAAALFFFAQLPDQPLTGAVDDVFSNKFAASSTLVTIPLFTFAGYVMAESGTPRRLVELTRAWLGWLPGGLALVALVASAFFTSFTGGSGITIVAIGGLLFPALMQDRYPEKFSLGLVTTGGSLGLLFPPSVPIIIYGFVAGIRIEKLFLAALIPGIVTVVALAGYGVRVGAVTKMSRTPFVAKEAFRTLWRTKWELLLPVVVIGGLYSGALKLNEAAAFTPLYVLIVEVFVYRDLSLRRDLPRVTREAVTLVGAIMIILATAVGFTGFLIMAQVPQRAVETIGAVVSEPWMFLLVLNVFLLVVGMLMDIFSAIVVVVPLIVPLAAHFGINPYHLGVVFLLNLEIGYLTPPVGLNLFISSFRFGRPVTALYRSVLPFIGLLVVALGVTTYVPQLSTYMAGLMDTGEVMQQFGPTGAEGGGMPERGPGGPDLQQLQAEDRDGGASGTTDLDALQQEIGRDGGQVETLEDLQQQGGGETLEDLEGELGGPPDGGTGSQGETLEDLEQDLGM